MHILITGAAGFIGFHLSKLLLERGFSVVGVDSLTDYYDVNLKQARLDQLKGQAQFQFHKLDICDFDKLKALFIEHKFDYVVHLAAQVGVRYSLENPQAYIQTNLVGFGNMLELTRAYPPKHFVYASSSSVYGNQTEHAFLETDNTDHPMSLYAATKKSNELMAYSYANLYRLPASGLRFFTVYGPWGRPDMAPFKFTKNILQEQPIDVYNHGLMSRDFTYVDDIVQGIAKVMELPFQGDAVPHRVFNIGNSKPVQLLDFIQAIEKAASKKAILNKMPMQPGDVTNTYADVSALQSATDYEPTTDVITGVEQFVKWYQDFYL